MNITILNDPEELGRAAAKRTSILLEDSIARAGKARLLLSTGMSQFELLRHLLDLRVDWSRVEIFHLDEYIGLPADHPASFRKYLRDRFIGKITPLAFYPVNGEQDPAGECGRLGRIIREAPVDVGLIGIGENAHIAFNDPPADFNVTDPYIIVKLDDRCKNQQVREGWFPDTGSVPERAISMSVRQILQCRTILSCVPHAVKAQAVRMALEGPVGPEIPASILRTHPAWELYLDRGSASGLDPQSTPRQK